MSETALKNDDTCQNCGNHLDTNGHATGCGNATCSTCGDLGEVRCECMDRPMYSDAGNPNHDGSPDECPECDQGMKPCPVCVRATAAESFDRIEEAIAAIRPTNPSIDADDTPLSGQEITIKVRRDVYGDWRLSVVTARGQTSGNFGPRPGRMLAGLFDALRECSGGDWTAFNRETGKAI